MVTRNGVEAEVKNELTGGKKNNGPHAGHDADHQ
jgi:hypothetical protein